MAVAVDDARAYRRRGPPIPSTGRMSSIPVVAPAGLRCPLVGVNQKPAAPTTGKRRPGRLLRCNVEPMAALCELWPDNLEPEPLRDRDRRLRVVFDLGRLGRLAGRHASLLEHPLKAPRRDQDERAGAL